MATLEINVKSTGIEQTTREIKKLDTELNKTSTDSSKVTTSNKKLDSSFVSLSSNATKAAGGIAALGAAYASLVTKGIKYLSTIEDQQAGLVALRVATVKNTDSLGKALTLQDKYNLAQKESVNTLKDLQEVNKKTPQQLAETIELYKVLVPTLGKAGASQKDLLKVTELLGKASASYGLQFNQLIAGTDGLASGTVLANSDLGKFLQTIGLSNDALKDTTNVTQLLIDKLTPLGGELNTLTVANSNLSNAFDELAGVVAEPFFEPLKESVISLTSYLGSATAAVTKFFNTFRDAENLAGITELNTRMVDLADKIEEKKQSLAKTSMFESIFGKGGDGKIKAEIRALNVELLTTSAEYNKFVSENGKLVTDVDKSIVISKKATVAARKRENALIEEATQLADAYYDISQVGLTDYEASILSVAQKTETWIKAGVAENDVLTAQSKLLSEINEKRDASLSDSIFEGIDGQFEALDELFEKKEEIFKDFADFKIEFAVDGLDDVSKSMLSIVDIFGQLSEESEKYNKAVIAASGDKNKLAEIESNHLTNQINSYGNIAGAMSSMFEQGTKEAEAFQRVQAGLAVVSGVSAIVKAGADVPTPLNFAAMASMAALVSSTLASANIAFSGIGGSSTSVSSDEFSSLTENTGIGTVLGDTEAQSESIVNAMGTLEDFAEPQFQTLVSMNKYLANISNNMAGVTSLLIRQGSFAFGAGASEYNTGFSNNLGNISGEAGIVGGSALGMAGAYGSMIGVGTSSALLAGTGVGLGVLAIDQLLLGGGLTEMIGGALNSVIGGLFGKTSVSQSLTDSGIAFADAYLKNAVETLDGSAYQTISTTVTKKSWFSSSSSTSIATYFEDLDDETNRQFSLVLDGLYQTTLLAGDALDTSAEDVASSLDDFIVSIGKISLKDKTGDEIQEQLEAVFGAIGDDIAKTAFPLLSAFQGVGEGMFETLTRVATGMEEAEYYISRLGMAFSDISYTEIENKQGDVGFEALLQSIVKTDEAIYGLDNNLVQIVESLDSTAEELYEAYSALDILRETLNFLALDTDAVSYASIRGAGSLSELASGMDDYIENYLTDAEQLAYETTLIQKEFSKLNIVMPNSKDAFTSLLESLDLSSESGQELYGSLITLSEGFATVADEVADSIEELQDALLALTDDGFDTLTDSFDAIFSSIQSMASSTISAITSINTTSSSSTQFSMLSEFNSLVAQFNASKETTDTDTTSALYSQVLSLGQTLASDSTYTDSILSMLENNLQGFENQEDILRVNIVEGLGDLLDLNSEQLSQLQTSVSDGQLTNDELSSISGLTETQTEGINAFAENSDYFSTEATLSNLEKWSKLQLDAYQASIAEETSGLSSSSFDYGDYIGKQEQIDIAQTLGTSYETAQPLIQQLQGLSISNDVQGDVESLLGFEEGDTSYDTQTAGQIKALSPYLSGDIMSAVANTSSSASANLTAKNEFDAKYSNATNAYLIEKQESDVALSNFKTYFNQAFAGWTTKSVTEEDISNGTTYRVSGFNAYNGAARDNMMKWSSKYSSEFAQAYSAYQNLQQLLQEKALKGYASGGYTGDGAKYDVAGLVHKGEYVVNQDQLQNAGGVGAVESFVNGGNKELTSVMNTLISYTKSILKENRELTALFKRVTNGGENMVVSLDA